MTLAMLCYVFDMLVNGRHIRSRKINIQQLAALVSSSRVPQQTVTIRTQPAKQIGPTYTTHNLCKFVFFMCLFCVPSVT